jgi:DNA-binding NtrC family response regulator
VVEDEVFIRMNTAEALMNAGFLVVQAATADEALQVLSSSVPVDLVFTDVQMPGTIDGLGLAHCVQSEWPRIKIVLASGHLQTPNTLVPDAFFDKPYLLPAVIDCVGRLLGEAHSEQS